MSTVNYREEYKVGSQNDDPVLKDIPNFSAMTLWTKLVGDSRADYIKAFMAISRVHSAMKTTNIITRYFTYNLFFWGYNDQSVVNSVALFGLDPSLQDAIFNDKSYGFNNIGTLGKWVQAFKEGKNSLIYQNILLHF